MLATLVPGITSAAVGNHWPAIQFVDPGYAHPALPFLVLGAIAQLVSGIYLTGLIFGGAFVATQVRRRRRLAAGVRTGIGAVFIGFGIKLATATTG